jgi:hypothetical protein
MDMTTTKPATETFKAFYFFKQIEITPVRDGYTLTIDGKGTNVTYNDFKTANLEAGRLSAPTAEQNEFQ